MLNSKQFIQLLEQEVEDFMQTQAEKIVSFEDDPKGYILQKYPSLKGTLEDLMTNSFDEYITGIYVMAPKPTTFKILLHNGQHFFLIYAKDSYIAKISGKKYYLLNLGEEEYAIKAIADLLTMGMPPGAKGPEGEEENDTTAGAEDTPEEAPADDTGGDEEELAETKEKKPKRKTPLKFKILKEGEEKKSSPLKFKIIKEADFNALTFFDLAKRGGFRFQILADKIKNGSAFELVGGESTPLQFINPDHADIFASGDSTEIKKLAPTSTNSFKFFKDDAGKEYSIKDLQKNQEFGGRGKGSGTIVEDYNLKLLKDLIAKLKEENGGNPINVVVGGKTYSDIVDAESQFGTPKSDFNLIDSKGNPVVFISHKKAGGKGASANDFIRWSGYTMYKDHPEVKAFNEALAKWVDKNNPGEGLPNKSRFISRIEDKELIQKLIYGPKFGEGFSKDNVSIILQGKIDLNPKGNNTYELTSQHDEIPPSIPEGEYYPYLTSAYRADREMFGIKNNEAIVMTKAQSGRSSNVYELQNGEFVKVR